MHKPEPTPRGRRVRLDLEAKLINSNSEEWKVIVIDLSSDGFRLRVSDPLFVGESIQLKLGRSGYAAGVVRWIEGNEAGGSFNFGTNEEG
ncbi:PilZ domain-containing protein [Sphingomonas sp. GCM10030256]|uniref:PilZ domain-containing protein n=1 Tax=Sphingomonas sp. GCM10030256 TaxID=3273427 RepID=UPI00362461CC